MASINWPEAVTALEDGRLPCSGGESRMLPGHRARSEPQVSWPSVEPAADYTAVSLLAFALGAQGGSPPARVMGGCSTP
jgi:hypothetical protein